MQLSGCKRGLHEQEPAAATEVKTPATSSNLAHCRAFHCPATALSGPPMVFRTMSPACSSVFA